MLQSFDLTFSALTVVIACYALQFFSPMGYLVDSSSHNMLWLGA